MLHTLYSLLSIPSIVLAHACRPNIDSSWSGSVATTAGHFGTPNKCFGSAIPFWIGNSGTLRSLPAKDASSIRTTDVRPILRRRQGATRELVFMSAAIRRKSGTRGTSSSREELIIENRAKVKSTRNVIVGRPGDLFPCWTDYRTPNQRTRA
ncbi:hypothetical protein DFH09DRAFT_1139276 [Mycena vulgaris]|nr:hypothetical protein DFH09DRAFT_1139276 [Mycena vulgaris]